MTLKLADLWAAILLASMLLGSQNAQAGSPAGPEYLVLVERSAYVMGTRVHLVTWGPTRHEGLAQLDRALAALEETEAQLSTWREDSTITSLNRSPVGTTWQAPFAICDMFVTLSEWHALSDGAFDPAIGRLTEAWGGHGNTRQPSAGEIARARASSGFARLDFDRDRCTLTRRADLTLDVGAFGKGEALDRAGAALGERPWMVDLGGQVSVRGAPPGLGGWPISIGHPSERQRRYLNLTVREGSLSTSGGSERDRIVGSQRITHILDPRTGSPVAFRGSVTVWHRRALIADILSTALFVMGPDEGIKWAESHEIAACFLVPGAGGHVNQVMTAAFRASVLSSGGREGH